MNILPVTMQGMDNAWSGVKIDREEEGVRRKEPDAGVPRGGENITPPSLHSPLLELGLWQGALMFHHTIIMCQS